MRITVTRVVRELQENYGWFANSPDKDLFIIAGIVKDTLEIVDKELKKEKGISIK